MTFSPPDLKTRAALGRPFTFDEVDSNWLAVKQAFADVYAASARSTVQAAGAGTVVRNLSDKALERLTLRDLGAKADGTDDGARISAALYSEFGGQSSGANQTYIQVEGVNRDAYTLATPIVVRTSRSRLNFMDSTILGAGGCVNAIQFTQDGTGAYGGNEWGGVYSGKFSGFTGAAITGVAANYCTIAFNHILNCGGGVDLNVVEGKLLFNDIVNNTGDAIILRSAISAGGVTPSESQGCYIFGNSARTNTGYALHHLYGGGHVVTHNKFQANGLGEVYDQCAFGNQYGFNYAESNGLSNRNMYTMDSVAGANPVAGRNATDNMHLMWTLGGQFQYDFDITGNNTILLPNRLGTGNAIIRAGSNNTLIDQQINPLTLTDLGAGTINRNGQYWSGIQGISNTGIKIQNAPSYFDLTGATLSGSVVFGAQEADAAYQVEFSTPWTYAGSPVSGAANIRITAKAKTGFSWAIDVANGASTTRYEWALARRF